MYSLTAFGESILSMIDAMCQWGTDYLERLDAQMPPLGGKMVAVKNFEILSK